jgi:DNA-binding SARP family transcriptional activator
MLLALAGLAGAGGVSRERVAGLLWADHPEARARQSLRQVLSDLRRDAGPLLAAVGQQLVLAAEHCPVDAVEFAELAGQARPEALERATTLYRGPLLDGLDLADAPGLDDWLQPERQRLEALNRAAFAKLLAGGDRSADPESLARIAARAVAFDPADESAWRVLMRAHHDAGVPEPVLRELADRAQRHSPVGATLAAGDAGSVEIEIAG